MPTAPRPRLNRLRLLVVGAASVLAVAHALRPYQSLVSDDGYILLRYARKLTASPGDIVEQDITEAQAAGADDGEILEVNQVCAYFNYSNRLLNGLGVTTDGDQVGYYKVEQD